MKHKSPPLNTPNQKLFEQSCLLTEIFRKLPELKSKFKASLGALLRSCLKIKMTGAITLARACLPYMRS